MPELTREEKLKLVEKLPQKLQDFLYSEDTGIFLLYLGNKYKLSDEKVSALSKIMADIILKITPIVSLAQEIVSKVISDPQTAMSIAQELNSDLLAPVLMPMPAVPVTPAVSAVPEKPPVPKTPIPAAPILKTDEYREPTASGPEIVDLRKTLPSPRQSFSEGGLPSGLPISAAPIPPRPPIPTPIIPPKPLTFTRPVEPKKLIEAEPHKIVSAPPVKTDTYREPMEQPLVSISNTQAMDVKPKEPLPQYIIRPPGLPPTDFPRDVLDLRKDKGEF